MADDADEMADDAAIDEYLAAFDHHLIANSRQRARLLEEVGDHLRDAVDDLAARGMTRPAAADLAIARFGSPEDAARRCRADAIGAVNRWAEEWIPRLDAGRLRHPLGSGVVAAAPSLVLILVVAFGVALMGPPGSLEPFLVLPLCLVPLVVGQALRARAVRNGGKGAGDYRSRVRAWNSSHPVLAGGIVLSPLVAVLGVGAFRHVDDFSGWLIMMSPPALLHFFSLRSTSKVDEPTAPVDPTLRGRARALWRHPETAGVTPALAGLVVFAVAGRPGFFLVFVASLAAAAFLRARAAGNRSEPTYSARRAAWEAEHPRAAQALFFSPLLVMIGYSVVLTRSTALLVWVPFAAVLWIVRPGAGRSAPERGRPPAEQG